MLVGHLILLPSAVDGVRTTSWRWWWLVEEELLSVDDLHL